MEDYIKEHLEETKRQMIELSKTAFYHFENEEGPFASHGSRIANANYGKSKLEEFGQQRFDSFQEILELNGDADAYADELILFIDKLVEGFLRGEGYNL